MIKECVVLNGQVIHIGEWDFQTHEDGKILNPMPVGVVIEQRDFEYDNDYGWYEVGTQFPKTEVQLLQEENAVMALELVANQLRLEQTESEQANLLIELVNKGVI